MRFGLTAGVVALACAASLAAASEAAAIPSPPSEEFFGITPATEISESESAVIARGGIGVLRVPFYWPHIEPERPSEFGVGSSTSTGERSRFGQTDRLVERAAANGIRIVPFVYGTPPWLADDPMRPPIQNTEQRREWQRFIGELVRRYGDGGDFWLERALTRPELPELPISTWQIWNEQNSAVFWSPSPRPGQYARLIALASSAIRAADPQAGIVLGGMFGTPTRGVRAARFLRRIHRGGHAAGAFDGYALHPYSPNLRGIRRQVRQARRALRKVDARGLPLWVTEIGWPTAGRKRFPLRKTRAGQKRMLARSYRLFVRRSDRWNVAGVFWYTWRDNDVMRGCIVCQFSGLFDRRLEAKPAWRKLTQFAGGRP